MSIFDSIFTPFVNLFNYNKKKSETSTFNLPKASDLAHVSSLIAYLLIALAPALLANPLALGAMSSAHILSMYYRFTEKNNDSQKKYGIDSKALFTIASLALPLLFYPSNLLPTTQIAANASLFLGTLGFKNIMNDIFKGTFIHDAFMHIHNTLNQYSKIPHTLSVLSYIALALYPSLMLNPTVLMTIATSYSLSMYSRLTATTKDGKTLYGSNLEAFITVFSIGFPIAFYFTGLLPTLQIASITSFCFGMVGFHQIMKDTLNHKAIAKHTKRFSEVITAALKTPKEVIKAISALKNGINTLDDGFLDIKDHHNVILFASIPLINRIPYIKDVSMNKSKYIYFCLFTYLSIQIGVSKITSFSTMIRKPIYDAMLPTNFVGKIMNKTIAKQMYHNIFLYGAFEASKWLGICFLSWFKRTISNVWQTAIRDQIITKVTSPEGRLYVNNTDCGMGDKKVNRASAIEKDAEDLIVKTIETLAQLLRVTVDIYYSAGILYSVSLPLFNVAVCYIFVNMMVFAFWQNMAEYQAKHETNRTKFRSSCNDMFNAVSEFTNDQINKLKQLSKNWHDNYVIKIAWDAAGSFTRVVDSSIMPVCLYILAPDIIQSHITLGTLRTAQDAFKQFYQSCGEILGDIKNFVKFSVTGTRVATVIDSLGRQAKHPNSLIEKPGIHFVGFLPSMDILRTDIRIANDKNKRDLHISKSDKFLKEEIQGENKTFVDYLLAKLQTESKSIDESLFKKAIKKINTEIFKLDLNQECTLEKINSTGLKDKLHWMYLLVEMETYISSEENGWSTIHIDRMDKTLNDDDQKKAVWTSIHDFQNIHKKTTTVLITEDIADTNSQTTRLNSLNNYCNNKIQPVFAAS